MAGFNPFSALYAGMKIKKGPASTSVRTPGTFAGGLYKPPADPGNQLDMGPDSGYTPQQIQEAKLTANPPREGYKEDGTKIGGLRRVLGTIASTVGPMIGGPAVAGLGDKLLYPGRDKYNSDLARAQRLSALSVDARNHQDLQANRKILENEHKAAQKARDENSYFQRIANNENHGALELPEAPSPVDLPINKQVAGPSGIQQIQSTTSVTPPEIDPVTGKPVSQAGTVDTVEGAGNLPKKRFMRYNANTQRELAVKKKSDELAATLTDTLSDDEAQQLNDLGFKGNFKGIKMTPADARARREDIKSRLNSRDSIAGKNEPRVPPVDQFIDEYRSLHPNATYAEALSAHTKATQAPQQPSHALMIGPDGKAFEVSAGTVVPQGSQTPMGVNAVSTPTAQTRSMAEMAKTVTEQVPSLLSQVDALKSKIGPVAGRWNQMWVNRGGADDPEFAGLDQDLDLFASALVRTHFGGRGGMGYREALKKDFSEAQSPEDLKARIQHADKWILGYAKAGEKKPTSETPKPAAGASTVDDLVKKYGGR